MKNPKRKYPHTKQLVRVAREIGGLTYEEIAKRACLRKTSKSQVSKWAKGSAKANYRQMESLINEFGHHLKKQYEHVFYQHKPKFTLEKYQALKGNQFVITLDVDGDKKSLDELNEEDLKSVINLELDDLIISCSKENRNKVFEVLFSLDLQTPRFEYFKIKGEKVFQHTFHHSFEYKKTTKRNSQYRIQVIKQSDATWFIVTQDRAYYMGFSLNSSTPPFLVHSSAEASIWWSQCHKRTSIADVISFMDNYANKYCYHVDCMIEARATLPYLIRNKLSELGYHLDEIVDMSDDSTDH